uniref:5-bromo-4-chloroindolyl phosphate hydrolysis family protein n=1 Tax=Candidatus Electrothrix sp. TaxID=2170559 RepID=UPI00405725F5
MNTVKLSPPKKSKALGCLYPMVREIIAGFGAIFVFLPLSIFIFIKDILDGSEKSVLWILAFALSLGTYFGIRHLFPPLYKKVEVELPEDLSKDTFIAFLTTCSENLTLLKKDAESINKLPFRSTVLNLCQLGDELLVNFEKVPRNAQVAQTLPDRLYRLHEMLIGYLDLSTQRNQSPQTMRAIDNTEKAVIKAVAKFEQLHHRLLENNAMDLSTNAKTLDDLLDFD